jgi:hypothetical protein
MDAWLSTVPSSIMPHSLHPSLKTLDGNSNTCTEPQKQQYTSHDTQRASSTDIHRELQKAAAIILWSREANNSVTKFATVYATRRIITVFTRARHWSLS